jgi:O-antigen/teichoic acid export membrane protein
MLLPLAGLIAGASREIVGFIFGTRFLPAGPLLAWLFGAAVTLAIFAIATAILTAAGKPGWTVALATPLLFFAAIGHVLIIPRFGPIGAAIVTTAIAATGSVASILAVCRLWSLPSLLPSFIRSLIAGGGIYVAAMFWPAPHWWILIKLPVTALLVPIALMILGEFSKDEIAWAKSRLRRPKHDVSK